MTRYRALVWGAVVTLALAARFVFETALVPRLPAAAAVCGALLPAAAALAALSFAAPAHTPVPNRDRLYAGAAGVLGLWLAPLLVAAARKSDAPPGSEVLFVTTALWGVVLVVAGLSARRRPAASQVTGALLGAVGAAAALANWERPSSFSPFVRFPTEGLLMLAAGAVFAVSIRLLAGPVRRQGPLRALRHAVLPAAAAGVLAALVAAPASFGAMAGPDVWPVLLSDAVAVGALALAWAELLAARPAHEVAAAYVLPVSVLSALALVERGTRLQGPTPLLAVPVVCGIAVCCVAAVLVAVPPTGDPAGPSSSRMRQVELALAGLAAAAGVVGLSRPDVAVSVTGTLRSGASFAVSFPMLGYETVGGWLAFLTAALVLGEAWRPGVVRSHALPWLFGVAVLLAAWVPLHSAQLHAWNRWLPPEVQQDYGTEYATRSDEPLTNVFEQVALVGTAGAAALVAFEHTRRRPSGVPDDGDATETEGPPA